MQFTITDEHRPGITSYQIVSGDYTVARGVNPSFAQLFIQMAETLNDIIAKDGMCIHGTADLHDAPDDIKSAFRDGSALAFARLAQMAKDIKANPSLDEREVTVKLDIAD